MKNLAMVQLDENTQEFKMGSIIFEEGDDGDTMYVVINGDIDLKLKGVTVNQVGTDEIFGEMALVDHLPRSATAHATSDCKLAVVDQKKFEVLVHQSQVKHINNLSRVDK